MEINTNAGVLGKISEWKASLSRKLSGLSEKNAKDYLSKKHDKRIEFYQLLIDFMRSPGESNPLVFFKWHLSTLDARMEKEPDPLKAWRSISKSKNQSTMRTILEKCDKHAQVESDINKILKPFLPPDEYRIIASAAKADITGEIESAIDIAEDKLASYQIKMDAVKSNVPVILIAFILHYILYKEIYTPAVTPGYMDKTDYSEMGWAEVGHYHYYFIIKYWYVFLAAFGGVAFYINWLIKNWSSRFLRLREHYIDYIPPFSISKLSEQYSLILIVASAMKSGANFYNALEEAMLDANDYIKYQIKKILSRSDLPAHEAFDTDYMGEFGSLIKDRGEHIRVDLAMFSLLEKIRDIKNKRLKTAINVSVKMTLRPIAIISVVLGLAPYIMDIVTIISDISDQV